MALRVDVGTLQPARELADGRLRADAYITRTGVFEYVNPDGSVRREWRPPEEVFRADALESFELVPVTNDHPPELLSADNARAYAVGSTGERVRADGRHVASSLTVFDSATIDQMKNGKVEVSCGYEVDIEEVSGETPDGLKYDAIQRNIRGNHVAIVDAGRAGSSVRVRMDAPTMGRECRLDSGVDMSKELAEAIKEAEVAKIEAKAARADADAAENRAKELERELAEAKNDAAEQKARADKAEASNEAAVESARADAFARIELEGAARTVLGAEAKFDGKTDREIKIAVVEKVDGEQKFDGKSDDYVAALYDSAVKRSAPSAGSTLEITRVDTKTGGNTEVNSETEAYNEMLKRNREDWEKARRGDAS